MTKAIILAVISLLGVTGEKLRCRAFFDANNVKVGDPLILTIDFIGSADFKELHPPALSREVNRTDWKVDDISAKTQTESTSQRVGWFSVREVDVARRLTYRVRPMREGVLWFPALEFEYEAANGERRFVKSNEIPVHAKPGSDVVVAEMGNDENAMPPPPSLIEEPGVALNDDEMFLWRRAIRNPTADNFKPFEFTAGRLNEARCATLEGDWKRAMAIYSRVEWLIGQTPEIEQGIVAALALRYQNPVAELPVWRQVGRVILKYDWKLRLGIVGIVILTLVLVFWLLGRIIRALACIAIIAALFGATSLPSFADDPFAEMEKMMRQHRQQMNQMMNGAFGNGGFSINFGGDAQKPPEVKASLAISKAKPKVGEQFDFIVSLEAPKNARVEPQQFTATHGVGLKFLTQHGRALPDGVAANTNNVVKRIAISARYDIPFRGEVGFAVGGMVSQNVSRGRGSFSFSSSFNVQTPSVPIEVCPLEDAPAGYDGLVASSIRIAEIPDALSVESNDVIRITYRLNMKGWLPEGWSIRDAAFECGRNEDRTGAITAEWQRYYVADGTSTTTPKVDVVYYDPEAKKFKTVAVGGSAIRFK